MLETPFKPFKPKASEIIGLHKAISSRLSKLPEHARKSCYSSAPTHINQAQALSVLMLNPIITALNNERKHEVIGRLELWPLIQLISNKSKNIPTLTLVKPSKIDIEKIIIADWIITPGYLRRGVANLSMWPRIEALLESPHLQDLGLDIKKKKEWAEYYGIDPRAL